MKRVLVLGVLLAGCHRAPTAGDLFEAGNKELALQSAPAARRAIVKYEQALGLTSDPVMQTKIQVQAAEATSICDPAHVVEALEKAVGFAAQTGDANTLLEARIELALFANASPEERIDHLRALQAEAHAAGARGGELHAATYLGAKLNGARRMTEAIPVLLGALELVRATPNPSFEVQVEMRLGSAYHQLGDADRAMPHFLRALTLARAARLPLIEAEIANNIGNVYLWLYFDYARALVYLSRATIAYTQLGMERSSDGMAARIVMASTQGYLGDHAGALASLTVALADARAMEGGERTVVLALLAMGAVYQAEGRIADGKSAFAEAMQIGKKIGDTHRFYTAVIGSARIALLDHAWREAEEIVGSYLTFIAAREAAVKDEQLRIAFAGAMRNGQQVLLEALAGQGEWTRAFAASERLRSRRLLAALGSDEIVDGAGAQALLDGDTTMVEYALCDFHAYAFVVDASSTLGIDLGPTKDVENAARLWYTRASSVDTPPQALDAATRALADKILAPLESRLHGRRLVIVPDRSLHYVAFAALPLADAKPLLERFELVHVPSASVLRALRARSAVRPAPTRELAILADPIFDRSDARLELEAPPPAAVLVATRSGGDADLHRLPSTHAEAQAIAALMPPEQVFLAEGRDATRAAALGPEVAGARRVHFATHALLDNVDPDRSALVFTQVDAAGKEIDGYVRVPDIEKSGLAAELVVLSACRTAIGKRFDGEGLIGLTRAFLRAGVPRVVSSLWQVEDAATADLMAGFYRGLLADRLSPPAALRRAQLAAARSAISLWAGFAFYGDWR